jgi:hypothetical protein
VPLSEEMAAVLHAADGRKTLSELLAENRIEGPERAAEVIRQAVELWTQRVITLRPAALCAEPEALVGA